MAQSAAAQATPAVATSATLMPAVPAAQSAPAVAPAPAAPAATPALAAAPKRLQQLTAYSSTTKYVCCGYCLSSGLAIWALSGAIRKPIRILLVDLGQSRTRIDLGNDLGTEQD
eukprot:366211-Chlamydomonas_euryale.AAC.4